jgi:hypothetical protein
MFKGVVVLNYPLENQVRVGHIETLYPMFEAYVEKLDKVVVLHPGKADFTLVWESIEYPGKHMTIQCRAVPRIHLRGAAHREKADVYRALFPFSAWCCPSAYPLVYSIHCNRSLPENRTWKDPILDKMHFGAMRHCRYSGISVANSEYLRRVYGADETHHNFWLPHFTPPKCKYKKYMFPLYVGRKDKFPGGAPPYPATYEGVCDMITGGVAHSDLVEAYRCHPFTVVPVMGGFTIIESLACGTPVLARDYEWASEIINEENGLLAKYVPDLGDFASMLARNWSPKKVASTVKDYTAVNHKHREMQYIDMVTSL